MGITPININFLEHVKFHPITLSKFLDLHICAWLLTTKLVAGERKDGQLDPSFAVLLVQLHQLGVVDPCLASLGGNIDQDTDLPLVFTKVHLFSINVLGSKLVYRFSTGRVPLSRD
eukprot:TRINITY_DN7286_c0_g1_i1.p1 TRINITY_DN7286_c0_g1~~TRINITY_DN7286_c0_g1_i1.p1  ORF type:complete len:116 (+),score=8.11 TRINITY_DN7286_c0_g1_i1:831-1178(+)